MFLNEIEAKLIAAGVCITGTKAGLANSVYKTSKASIPSGDGPYLTLIETGGSGGALTQNDTGTQRPTMQISVRCVSSIDARTLLKSAYDALGGVNGLWNVTLSSIFYLKILARNEPTDIGEDASGRAMVAFNIDAEKQPS